MAPSVREWADCGVSFFSMASRRASASEYSPRLAASEAALISDGRSGPAQIRDVNKRMEKNGRKGVRPSFIKLRHMILLIEWIQIAAQFWGTIVRSWDVRLHCEEHIAETTAVHQNVKCLWGGSGGQRGQRDLGSKGSWVKGILGQRDLRIAYSAPLAPTGSRRREGSERFV